jgi:hypothetical protein
MNAWVLSNPLFKLQHNEQKEIVQAKTHATCEWDHLRNDALIIKPTPKPTLVKVTFSKLLTLLAIPPPPPPHVMTKLEKDEDLVSLIRASKVSYAK